jgi:hypothetical protein
MVLFPGWVLSKEVPKDIDEGSPRVQTSPDAVYSKETGGQERFLLLADVDLLLTLSDLEGADRLWGGTARGVITPVYRVTDHTYVLMTYDGLYSRKRDFYSDDVGPRERSEFQSHTLTPMVRFDFGPDERYSLSPSVFHTRTYNKDLEAGAWDEGLYNYRDNGGGLDFDIRKAGFGRGEGTFRLGLQYYERRYPNYDSLLDLAIGLDTEKDEKDYKGWIARLGYDWIQEKGFSWQAEYSLLYKRLKDKRVVDENGVLLEDKQRDFWHTLEINGWYRFERGFCLGTVLTGGLYRSDQNFYDGLGSLTLADDVFTPDFYDSTSFRVEPYVSYTLPWFPLTATLSYAYEKVDYDDRTAKFSDGTYKAEEQWETRHETEAELRYRLGQYWSIVGLWRHVKASSNNDDERTYRYDYETDSFSLGVSFSY